MHSLKHERFILIETNVSSQTTPVSLIFKFYFILLQFSPSLHPLSPPSSPPLSPLPFLFPSPQSVKQGFVLLSFPFLKYYILCNSYLKYTFKIKKQHMKDIDYLEFIERKHLALPRWRSAVLYDAAPSSATNVARSL